MSSVLRFLVLTICAGASCSEPSEHLFESFHLCHFTENDIHTSYLVAGECRDVPTANFIQPTDWGVGGGYTIDVDTCATPPRFFLIAGDFAVDTTDALFSIKRLQHLPALEREEHLPRPNCRLRLHESM